MMSERLTYSVDEAAKLLGISRNSAFAGVKAGEIPSVKIGHRRLVPVAALQKMLADAAGGPASSTIEGPSHGQAT
jgi:excisionase family DNA binding protein